MVFCGQICFEKKWARKWARIFEACEKLFVAKKSGLLPGFKNGFGHVKPLELLGLRALWPKTHFIFLLVYKNKIIYYCE